MSDWKEKQSMLELAYQSNQRLAKKLQQYKDIEKELDIDLILVSKVLTALSNHYVFVKEMKLVHKEGYSVFEETGEIKRTIIVHFSRYINGTEDWFFSTSFITNSYNYLVKGYGKTWALTREELESKYEKEENQRLNIVGSE